MNRWDVHKFRVPDINVSYPKFVIVAQLYSTSFLGVLINTDMTILQKETPAMHKCHPVILQSEHPFLDYDSRIGCASAFELDVQFLTQTNFKVVSRAKLSKIYCLLLVFVTSCLVLINAIFLIYRAWLVHRDLSKFNAFG